MVPTAQMPMLAALPALPQAVVGPRQEVDLFPAFRGGGAVPLDPPLVSISRQSLVVSELATTLGFLLVPYASDVSLE